MKIICVLCSVLLLMPFSLGLRVVSGGDKGHGKLTYQLSVQHIVSANQSPRRVRCRFHDVPSAQLSIHKRTDLGVELANTAEALKEQHGGMDNVSWQQQGASDLLFSGAVDNANADSDVRKEEL